jgi:AAA ATPase domain
MPSGNSANPRKRGVILTSKGAQKIRDAIAHVEVEENFGQKLTIAALSIRIRLTSDTITKVLDREQGVDRRTLDSFFRSFNLELSESDYCQADLKQAKNPKNPISPISQTSPSRIQINLGEVPDVPVFYGRTEELQALEQWLLHDRCRLVTVLGMGGIGKSSLIARLLHQIVKSQDGQLAIGTDFQYVVWRSLRYAPTVEETLAELIHSLSHQQEIDLPKALNQLISRLISYLNQTRCLLVLDNLETILQGGEGTGDYREGFKGYGELIQRIGKVPHKSCLIDLIGNNKEL